MKLDDAKKALLAALDRDEALIHTAREAILRVGSTGLGPNHNVTSTVVAAPRVAAQPISSERASRLTPAARKRISKKLKERWARKKAENAASAGRARTSARRKTATVGAPAV